MNIFFKRIIHRIAQIPVMEQFLLSIAKNKRPESIAVKILSPHFKYPKPSLRTVRRKNLVLHLDISDLIGWYAYFEIAEPGHEALLSLIKNDSVVFDIGSNIGITAMRSALKAKNGYVHAFEASLENYNRCKEHIQANRLDNVMVYQVAVGESNGYAKMHYRDPSNLGMNQIEKTFQTESSIPMISIDDFCITNKIKPNVIKIDTEGYEVKILKGAIHTIDSCRPILFIEVDSKNLEECGNTVKELVDLLLSKHYTIADALNAQPLIDTQSQIICQDFIAVPS